MHFRIKYVTHSDMKRMPRKHMYTETLKYWTPHYLEMCFFHLIFPSPFNTGLITLTWWKHTKRHLTCLTKLELLQHQALLPSCTFVHLLFLCFTLVWFSPLCPSLYCSVFFNIFSGRRTTWPYAFSWHLIADQPQIIMSTFRSVNEIQGSSTWVSHRYFKHIFFYSCSFCFISFFVIRNSIYQVP